MASCDGRNQCEHSDVAQLLQEREQGQQGFQGNFQNRLQFATLNQFLANQPMSFTYCEQPFDADDWLHDISKHFECSNVRPEDFIRFASFQLKGQAADWCSSTRIPGAIVLLLGTIFAVTSDPITFRQASLTRCLSSRNLVEKLKVV